MSRVSLSIFAPILYAGSTRSAVAEAVEPWHAAWKSEALGAEELLNLHALVQLNGANRFFFNLFIIPNDGSTSPNPSFWGWSFLGVDTIFHGHDYWIKKDQEKDVFLAGVLQIDSEIGFFYVFPSSSISAIKNTAATFLNHPVSSSLQGVFYAPSRFMALVAFCSQLPRPKPRSEGVASGRPSQGRPRISNKPKTKSNGYSWLWLSICSFRRGNVTGFINL